MKKWFLKRRVCRKLQAGLCSLVVVSLTLAPISAEATQTGSQTSSGNTNNMASMLSTGVAVLSMATGALTMAKGAQQMACCMKGCDGAGKEGVEKKASNDSTSKAVADKLADKAKEDAAADGTRGISSITVPGGSSGSTPTKPANRSEPEFQLRFPDSASLDKSFGATARLGLLVKLFRAPTVNASGCIDAALALATGGLMLLQGMMAMASAKQAAANADTSYSNAGTLGAIDQTGGTMSGVPGSGAPGESKLGDSKLTGASATNGKSTISLDPAMLRNGKADVVMSRFEKQFGLDRDQFANDIASGKDPRELLANAPKNALSVADLNKATSAARGMSDAEKQDALSASELAEIQKEMAANAGFGLEDTSYNSAGKGSGASRKIASLSSDALDDLGGDAMGGVVSAGLEDSSVSPEIKAALAQREEDLAKKSHFDTSLFEVVHRKYREKAKMISGAGIKAVGVVHAVGE